MAENLREIVNGEQLPLFSGKQVSIIGSVKDVTGGTNSFTLKATDNVMVPINLKTPLSKPLEGYVEVIGVSQGKSVLADDFVCFSNEDFDSENHNVLCKLLRSIPNLWE